MPIDSSIPLQVKQPEFQDPSNQLLRILQIQGLQDSRAKTQRDVDNESALNRLYQVAVGPDGTVDRTKLVTGAASQGLGSKIPGLQKQFLDNDKTQSDIDQAKAKAESERVQAAHTRIDVIGQASAWVRQNPTAENAIAATQHLQQNGILTPEQAQASIARIQADPSPQTIAQNADMAFRSAVQAKDQLPKLTDFAAGDRHVNQSVDPITGKVTETGSTVIGQSADNVATNATSRANNAATVGATIRGQDLTDARSRDANAQGKTQIVETPQGYVIVDKNTGQSRPATAADGKPLQGKANDRVLTDSQAKANLFGTRMQESDRIMSELEKKGVERPGAIKSIAQGTGRVLGLGTESAGGALSDALGAATNFTQSPQQQQVEQAQRDFVNAVLRRESGAAISPSEFSSAEKQYFPQVGDSPAVLAQKRQNRQLAIHGLAAEVPGGFRDGSTPGQSGQGGASGGWSIQRVK